MSLKFNCSEPGCRQRIEVDDALAGATIQCPACAKPLRVPASHDIRFHCANPDCRQHIVVDVSEAGRFLKCPACARILRIPGDPPKSLDPEPPAPHARTDSWPARQTETESVLSRWAGWRRLAWGWGTGAALFGLLLLVFHWRTTAALPPNLATMAEEIHLRYYPDRNQLPAPSVFAKEAKVVEAVATNAQGKVFDYFYVAPPAVESGRKYPVVVDQSSAIKNRRMRDIQFLANAGIFYVSPNRYGITNWGVVPEMTDVLAVLDELGRIPGADTDRCYVMGQSRSIGAAVALINAYPERWRGVLLMEPGGGFPFIPAEAKRFPSIFISMGRADRFNQGVFGPGVGEKNLMKACARGIPARIDYQDGGHGYPPEELKRAYLAAVRFILTDY